jgi:hypothetical protein
MISTNTSDSEKATAPENMAHPRRRASARAQKDRNQPSSTPRVPRVGQLESMMGSPMFCASNPQLTRQRSATPFSTPIMRTGNVEQLLWNQCIGNHATQIAISRTCVTPFVRMLTGRSRAGVQVPIESKPEGTEFSIALPLRQAGGLSYSVLADRGERTEASGLASAIAVQKWSARRRLDFWLSGLA